MIEFDYTIIRNEGNETVTYRPNKIPTQIPNLVYIEGPNSSGKSTLLNLISLGMQGLNKENIAPALKNKMKALHDSSYQEVSFQIKIHDTKNNVELITEKKGNNKQIQIVEVKDGKRRFIAPDRIEREYNLIYDIPDNPTERLNQLTVSIKDTQNYFGNRISSLTMKVQQIINEIKNSRDPQQIDNLTREIEKQEFELKELIEKLKLKTVYYQAIQKYTFIRSYLEYLDKLERKKEELRDYKKKEKNKKKQDTLLTKKQINLKNDANNLLDSLSENYAYITPQIKRIFSNKRELIEVWERVNINDARDRLEFNKNFGKTIGLFWIELQKLTKNETYNNTFEEAEIWRKVISVLEDYKLKDIIVPGAEKKIGEFISILKSENKKHQDAVKFVKTIKELEEYLDEMDQIRIKLEEEIFPELRDCIEITDWFNADEKSDLVIEQIEDEIKKLKHPIEKYMNLLVKSNISYKEKAELDLELQKIKNSGEITNYDIYSSEDQLIEKIEILNNEIIQEEITINKKGQYIEYQQNDLTRLQNKEPHKYQKYYDDLMRIFKKCQMLDSKFKTKYNKYIKAVIDGVKVDFKEDDQKKYFHEVSKYLGRRIGYIKFGDLEYKVDSIDMIKGEINTDIGKIIRLIDMGTGQSQSAYLLGQLNSSDNRKIIALFDEVAMMDKKSLKPIFEKLKELYDNGKLLVGVVVQMGEEIKIEEIVR